MFSVSKGVDLASILISGVCNHRIQIDNILIAKKHVDLLFTKLVGIQQGCMWIVWFFKEDIDAINIYLKSI